MSKSVLPLFSRSFMVSGLTFRSLIHFELIFIAVPTKIPITFFTELQQIILKFIQNHKIPQITQGIFRKKRTKLEVSCSLTSDYTSKLQ